MIDEQHYRWALAVVDAAGALVNEATDSGLLAEELDEWEALDNLLAAGVHSCGPHCQHPYCRMRREIAELRNALADCASGLRYARLHHGELSGVGFDRALGKADAALSKESSHER